MEDHAGEEVAVGHDEGLVAVFADDRHVPSERVEFVNWLWRLRLGRRCWRRLGRGRLDGGRRLNRRGRLRALRCVVLVLWIFGRHRCVLRARGWRPSPLAIYQWADNPSIALAIALANASAMSPAVAPRRAVRVFSFQPRAAFDYAWTSARPGGSIARRWISNSHQRKSNSALSFGGGSKRTCR